MPARVLNQLSIYPSYRLPGMWYVGIMPTHAATRSCARSFPPLTPTPPPPLGVQSWCTVCNEARNKGKPLAPCILWRHHADHVRGKRAGSFAAVISVYPILTNTSTKGVFRRVYYC